MAYTRGPHPVVRQDWMESERGWGQRPDGYSLHRTAEDCKRFIKEYWSRMPPRDQFGNPPDEYSFPSGEPFVVDVDQKTYDEVCASDCGVWHYR